jgi:chemotaxis protein MotB
LDPGALDWELSSERAVNVLRHLVEDSGVVSNRISAVGFGESRPLKTSGSDDDLAMNRRVDIVVLSGQPEAIRNLMPEVLKDPVGAAKDAAAERAEMAKRAAEADAAAKAAAEGAEADGAEGKQAERVAGEPGGGGSGGGKAVTGGNGTVGPAPHATYAPAPGGKSSGE